MKFTELGLAPSFLRTLEKLGYETASPIQAQAIPVVLAQRDLIGCAQTGTGKTAAFALPMLDRLMQTMPEEMQNQPEQRGPRRPARGLVTKPRALRALILAPTRELAAQISDSLNRYGQNTPLRQTVVFGGVSQYNQVKALRSGVDTLVATPGRLLDLMDQGYIDLSKVEILIFDEADQMLDMGFLPALKRIVASVPKQRQTLMFSATMPPEIRRLAQQWLTDPAAIEVAPVSTPAERIAQSVHFVDRKRKSEFLSRFLKETARSRTLVFVRTKHEADKIVKHLERDGLRAAAIHGNKSQNVRTRTLAQFKSKNPPVLIATDIAARGLDVNDVSHVVNFDLPDTPETYVHRIGRTARAGAEGTAVSFCAGDERGLLRQIERLTRFSIPIEPTLEGFEPSEPIQYDSQGPRRRGGGGNRGPARSGGRSGARPGRKPQRPAAHGESRGEGQSRNSSTEGTAGPRKKGKFGGQAAAGSRPQKRRRRSNDQDAVYS